MCCIIQQLLTRADKTIQTEPKKKWLIAFRCSVVMPCSAVRRARVTHSMIVATFRGIVVLLHLQKCINIDPHLFNFRASFVACSSGDSVVDSPVLIAERLKCHGNATTSSIFETASEIRRFWLGKFGR